MTQETLKEAQDFLTIVNNGKTKRIIDIEMLIERHQTETILLFMNKLLKEKEDALKGLVVKDKTAYTINETIGAMFRLHMAIRAIEKEEKI